MAQVRVFDHGLNLILTLEVKPGDGDHTLFGGEFAGGIREFDAGWLGHVPINNSDVDFHMTKNLTFWQRIFGYCIMRREERIGESPDKDVHLCIPTINSFMNTYLRKFEPQYYNERHSKRLGVYWDRMLAENRFHDRRRRLREGEVR